VSATAELLVHYYAAPGPLGWVHNILIAVVSPSVCVKEKVKEVDLYSAFIEVPHTQGAQVRITQCYLQITLNLPLPRKHSPDGASQTEVADI